jgi:hypothetical protein
MKFFGTLAVTLILLGNNQSFAVENGTDAKGDPNAVRIMQSSGFLYAPRIVFTAAHLFGNDPDAANRPVSILFPGRASNSGGILSIKTFIAPGYKDRKDPKSARQDDFAVVVLESPISMTNKVKVASSQDIERYALNKSKIELVGYGFQFDRNSFSNNSGKAFFPRKLTSVLLSENETSSIKKGLPPDATYSYDLNFKQSKDFGSICDNDSGAGWFVQEGKDRTYLGANSSAIGLPNCGNDGNWGPNGSLASASAAYKYLDLIKEAEIYAQNAPIKTRCYKGYSLKIVQGLKCPKNFKKVA